MSTLEKPVAIFHEHPDWFRPLFQELEDRGLPYVRIDPRSHNFDPSLNSIEYSLAFNRMSPSAYLRDGVQGIFYTRHLLAHLDRLRYRTLNGSRAFDFETSKAKQLVLLESLGLDYPRSRVFNHSNQIEMALTGLRFPVVVKANIGGSGAGIFKFDSREELLDAARANRIELGIDFTALLQEYVVPRGGHIVRVELLGGQFLYAIKVYSDGSSFNLCPADICQRLDGTELTRNACPANASKNGMQVEAYTPPEVVIRACESIMQSAAIDVGGIEYFVDDRDGSLLYYDINALSNFVADAENVVGFNPTSRLADYIEQQATFATQRS